MPRAEWPRSSLLLHATSSGPSAESAGCYVLAFPPPYHNNTLVSLCALHRRTKLKPIFVRYPHPSATVTLSAAAWRRRRPSPPPPSPPPSPPDGMVLVDESPGRRPVTALTSGAVLSGSRSVPDILTKHGMPPTPLLPARRAGHPPGGQRSVPSSRELSYLHDTSDTQPMSPGPAYLTPGFSSAVSQVCWLNPYPICAHIDPPPCVQCNRQLN